MKIEQDFLQYEEEKRCYGKMVINNSKWIKGDTNWKLRLEKNRDEDDQTTKKSGILNEK